MSRSTLIKICGVRSAEIASSAVEAGADAIGLVIDVPGSPRTQALEAAAAVARTIPRHVMTVAVLKDPTADLVEAWTGTWVQLHGDEDEALVERAARSKHVIKGFRFSPEAVRRWNACPHVELLLVDGAAAGAGGGKAFDHAALRALMPQVAKPIIVAGGLTAGNVGAAVRALRPFAVDVSGGVESAPGKKDPALIRAFCAAVTAADGGAPAAPRPPSRR